MSVTKTEDLLDAEISLDAGDAAEETMIPLPMGRGLTLEDLYPISACEQTHFCVFAGETGSGKTTLLTSIYHQFLRSADAFPYLFAGSQTLMSFEERAFYLRITSNRSDAAMKRTPRRSDDNILHLRLKHPNQPQAVNLLFSDLSGENFEAIIGDVDVAKEEFSWIFRMAHRTVLLLDGAKLINVQQRQETIQRMIHLIRTLWDGHLIGEASKLILVVSKYDLIITKHDDNLIKKIDRIPDTVQRQLPGVSSQFAFHRIAAFADNNGDVESGCGIPELLTELLEAPKGQLRPKPNPLIRSQFNLWKGRIL